MRAWSWMQPRHLRSASRTVSGLTMVAGLVTVLLALVDPNNSNAGAVATAVTVVIALLIVLAGWLARHLTAGHALAWALSPFLAVLTIVVLDFISQDASVSAQVFLFFPVLYAASQLPRRGAVAVTVATAVGEMLVVYTQLPVGPAFVDSTFVITALTSSAVLLVRTSEAHATLVKKLKQQAAIDPLTGLVTRRVLDQAAQSALSGAASGAGTGLIVLDVDEFKAINDQHGHPGGDTVLVQLAALLRSGVDSEDIISRLGGDEIAILLPGCSIEELNRRAEQVMVDVRAHRFALAGDQLITVSISAGLAHAPTHAIDLRRLYAAADAALYEAKRGGRNRIAAAGSPLTQELGS